MVDQPDTPTPPQPIAPWEPDKLGDPRAIYTPQLAATVLGLLAAGLSLISIAKREGMPCRATVYKWIEEEPGFADDYTRARSLQADSLAEEVVEIADTEPDTNRAKTRIDARKWYAGQVAPKKYGNRLDVNQTGMMVVAQPTAEELQAATERLLDKL